MQENTFIPQPKWRDYRVENYCERHKRATPEEQKKLEAEKNRLEKQRKPNKSLHPTKKLACLRADTHRQAFFGG